MMEDMPLMHDHIRALSANLSERILARLGGIRLFTWAIKFGPNEVWVDKGMSGSISAVGGKLGDRVTRTGRKVRLIRYVGCLVTQTDYKLSRLELLHAFTQICQVIG